MRECALKQITSMYWWRTASIRHGASLAEIKAEFEVDSLLFTDNIIDNSISNKLGNEQIVLLNVSVWFREIFILPTHRPYASLRIFGLRNMNSS